MAINPLIALSGEKLDTATPIMNYQKMKSEKANQELVALQTANAKVEGMTAREKARIESVVGGAAELGTYLDSNNIEGGERYLNSRRQELGKRIAAGEDVDTRETDEALEIIRSRDPEKIRQLQGHIGQMVKLGQLRGILKTPIQIEGRGGSSVFSSVMAEIDGDPELSQLTTMEKIRIAQNKVGTNLTVNADGSVSDMAGAAESLGNIKYGEQSGAEKAKNENEPGRAGAVEAEKQAQQLEFEQKGAADKKSLQANDVLDIAGQAREILLKGEASGSGFGSALAAGKQFVGQSDEQTQADAQLEVLGGKLVMSTPRMEGPQSDKDVQLYRELAGKLANRNVPAKDKLAALDQIVVLNTKYATGQSSSQDDPLGLR